MAKWLLLDGSNLVYRSFYAIPELTRSDGFPTNAIHGWIRTLWRLEDMEQPDGMAVFFDAKGVTEREKLFPDYKANRNETPESLSQQFPWVKRITEVCGFPMREQEGLEADDLIATAALSLLAQGHTVKMVSADKDLGQLVRPGIAQLLPPPTANPRVGWQEVDESGIFEKYGLQPKQIRDYLALVGDASDNIPGVEGVGPKTATRWLQEWGSIEGVIAHASELKPMRFQEKVPASLDQLRLSYELTGLHCQASMDPLEMKPCDAEALIRIFEELEMKTAVNDAEKRYRVGYLF
jgi:DNA polymerase-1